MPITTFPNTPTGDDNQEPEWFKRERGYTDHDFPGERPEMVQELAEALARVKSSDDIKAPAHPSERVSE